MLRIKLKNKKVETVETGHDTRRTADKKQIVVVDVNGKDVDEKVYDAAEVEVVERVKQ